MLLPRGHQQGPYPSQSGPYFRNGAEKIWWISVDFLTPSVKQVSDFFHVPIPRPKQAPFDH